MDARIHSQGSKVAFTAVQRFIRTEIAGGVIVMFGMVVAAGVNMLSDVVWNRRNMVIFAVSISVGLGLQLVPDAMTFLSPTMKILMTSGLLPAAALAIILNLIIPGEEETPGSREHAAEKLSEGFSNE